MSLPDPREHPLLRPDELLDVLPLRRSALYEAIRRGEIPSVSYGRRVYVVNALLQQQLGLTDPDMNEAGSAEEPALVTKLATTKREIHEHHTPDRSA